MNVPISYAAAWQTYRKRRVAFMAAVFSFAVLLALVGLVPTPALFASYWWTVAPFFFVWFTIAGFRLTYWHCPRCNKPFFTRLLWGNLFARRCLHCGLAKWSNVESAPRGA